MLESYQSNLVAFTRVVGCWHASTANWTEAKFMTHFLATASSTKCWLSGGCHSSTVYWVLSFTYIGCCHLPILGVVVQLHGELSITYILGVVIHLYWVLSFTYIGCCHSPILGVAIHQYCERGISKNWRNSIKKYFYGYKGILYDFFLKDWEDYSCK